MSPGVCSPVPSLPLPRGAVYLLETGWSPPPTLVGPDCPPPGDCWGDLAPQVLLPLHLGRSSTKRRRKRKERRKEGRRKKHLKLIIIGVPSPSRWYRWVKEWLILKPPLCPSAAWEPGPILALWLLAWQEATSGEVLPSGHWASWEEGVTGSPAERESPTILMMLNLLQACVPVSRKLVEDPPPPPLLSSLFSLPPSHLTYLSPFPLPPSYFHKHFWTATSEASRCCTGLWGNS